MRQGEFLDVPVGSERFVFDHQFKQNAAKSPYISLLVEVWRVGDEFWSAIAGRAFRVYRAVPSVGCSLSSQTKVGNFPVRPFSENITLT